MKDYYKIEWKEWWRHVEGEVSFDKGFRYVYRDSDHWYFDVDPDDCWQEQIDEENDPRYMHVDELFDNERDATEAAKEWLRNAEDELNDKKSRLGLYSRVRRCDECDAEIEDEDYY